MRKSVVPAALAFAGCFSNESERPAAFEELTYQTAQEGGACEVEHITYQVRGALVESSGEKSAAREGSVRVTVAESSSVVECGEDLMKIAMPGAELASVAFNASTASFALDVPGVVIGGHRPSIWVQALLDENENGECDEGELVGAAELDAVDLDGFELELSRTDGCPGRS